MAYLLSIPKIALFIKHHAFILPFKIVLLNANIDIFWMSLGPWWHMSIPKNLWSDTILSACHLINKMSSPVLDGKILFYCLYLTKSVFSTTLSVFGYNCFVQDLSPGLDNLSPRFIKCVLAWHSRTQRGYRCYNPSTRKYFVSADVTFFWCSIFPP